MKTAAELNELLTRLFYLPSFDDRKKRQEILGPLPNTESLEKEQQKVQKARAAAGELGILRPYYEGALLTREQEYHLFRQYNYWKHRARKRLKSGHLCDANKMYCNAQLVRNKITEANCRLTSFILRKNPHNEDMVADGYTNVMKAVDYFDFRRGIKFSTYCTWVLQRGTYRFHENEVKHLDKYTNDELEDPIAKDNGLQAEADYVALKRIVRQLLKNVNPREAVSLRRRYGIDCEPEILRVVGAEMNVSKERVRQIQATAINKIRAFITASPKRESVLRNMISA